MKQIITKDDVSKAIQALTEQGKKATLASIHAALNNRGSMSTLVRLKAEIDAATQPVNDSAEGLKTFREVWALAVDEGRKQQDAVILDLRESIRTLALENERLEGAVLAAQNHSSEIEQAKAKLEEQLSKIRSSTEDELKQTKAALTEATYQTASSLQKLAELQSAHAAQIAHLQSELNTALQKAHEMELKAVRTMALLEARSTQIEPESRKGAQVRKSSDSNQGKLDI